MTVKVTMASQRPDHEQTVAVPAPYDFDETLRFARVGPGDPTARRGSGWFTKSWWTPAGEVTLRLERSEPHGVHAMAWGPGAAWAVARVPSLLGLADRPEPCRPSDPGLSRLARRFAGLRLTRVPWPLDNLLGYILQQRVTFDDAVASWRGMLQRYGVPAPGPVALKMLPPAAALLRCGDHDWRAMGVDRQRQDALREALRYAHRVRETADMDLPLVRRRLAALHGVGPWTVNITMGFVFGDPDAVPTGDYHLPDTVAWALAGEPRADDARMLALLEPHVGQRFRIIRWLYAAGISAPRRGPRRPLPRRDGY